MVVTAVGERPVFCPRCGEDLRFEDEDGVRECACGWSERSLLARWAQEGVSDGDGGDGYAGASDAGPSDAGPSDRAPLR